MILNKKYKCPVCEEESITLRDRFKLGGRYTITCKNCSKLGFSSTTDIVYSVFSSICGFSIYLLPKIAGYSLNFSLVILIPVAIIFNVIFIVFGKLEETDIEEPCQYFNEILDNIRNPVSKKT